MSDASGIVGSFYDFNGLRQLRANAASDNAAATTRKAASEFEAAFMQIMLQTMKQASEPLKSDLLDDNSSAYFQDMFFNEMAHFIAARQSMGLGKWVEDSLTPQTPGQPD
jgi:flagellar protein FlgJ